MAHAVVVNKHICGKCLERWAVLCRCQEENASGENKFYWLRCQHCFDAEMLKRLGK